MDGQDDNLQLKKTLNSLTFTAKMKSPENLAKKKLELKWVKQSTHDSVTEQLIDCFTRLISPDFNHKAWNKSSEFSTFIKPATNYC